ncbi:hypothetical protein [Anatilimnocola floriformis]|uniref:hypothetical protein n=1 Tax=Anatilimnocola floriformis TaxID=2948575 RepID=UPI0020C327FD|nr:hypothetical protein [Anatilimnocola floriformis]
MSSLPVSVITNQGSPLRELLHAKKKGGKVGKRGRKPMAVPMDNIQQLIQVKKFVDQIGGLEKAKAAVSALAQILS